VLEELVPRFTHLPESIPQVYQSPQAFSEEEMAVLACLSHVPIHVDQICRTLQREASNVLSLLLSLELKGQVNQEAGNRFSRSTL